MFGREYAASALSITSAALTPCGPEVRGRPARRAAAVTAATAAAASAKRSGRRANTARNRRPMLGRRASAAASATRRPTSRQYSGPWSGSTKISRLRPSSVSRVSFISQSAARLVDGPRQQRSLARAVLSREASVPAGTPRMAAVVA